MYLTDKIKNNMEKDHHSVVLMDLQKEFDAANHDILLTKLRAIGFKGNCINWFSSYLSNWSQCVDIIGHHSKYHNVTCGVP